MKQQPRRREPSALESPRPSRVCGPRTAYGWSGLAWAVVLGGFAVLGSACSDASGDESSEAGGAIGGTGTGATLETNRETSSVFTTDASATGPWPDSQVTNSGRHVFEYIAERCPVTMSQ